MHDIVMDPLLGQLLAEKWRVTDRSDRAAGAHVYRVERVTSGERAVLEVAAAPRERKLGELARFDREARIASQVTHPQLARILDFGTWHDRPFVVSEVPPGDTLASLIAAGGMTRRRAVAIASQVLEVVRHLHAHGVVHRDVTPERVLVVHSPAGVQVKLSPPGLGLADSSNMERRIDQAGDLLAVGRMLQAMCEDGASPLASGGEETGTPAMEMERAAGERLASVVAKATAPQPAVRFQSAEELLLAVVRATGVSRPPLPDGRTRVGRKTTRPARIGKVARSRVRLAWAVVGAVAIAGTGVVIASARAGRRAAPGVEASRASDVPVPEASPAHPALPPAQTSPFPPPSPSLPPPPPPSIRPMASTKAPPSRAVPVEPDRPARPPALQAVAPRRAEPRTTPAPPGARPTLAIELVPITEAERAEVLHLIDARDNVAASEKIRALMQRDPRAAWPHVALAELHFRNLWRRDVVRQWIIALARDPGVKDDPHLAKHLCLARGPKWEAAGIAELLAALGEQGAALLASCPS